MTENLDVPKLVGAEQRERDETQAAKVLQLLEQIPLQATWGNIEEQAAEVREMRRWLQEFLPGA